MLYTFFKASDLNLRLELDDKFIFLSGRKLPNGSVTEICLHNSHGPKLRIFSKMRDFSERLEIGSLCFERIKRYDNFNFKVNLDNNYPISIKKMVILIEGKKIESGLCLNYDKDKLIILPSDSPYALYVSTDTFQSLNTSEYELITYSVEEL
ncbi:hypothetical protein WJT86_12115 [Microvirga sp. W0021]|uniref:Uncharacterized protein n=1 Tax=Hohaiivirga grylli TaxID=3133970 RepID=A0ABV0BLD7_9HYPH